MPGRCDTESQNQIFCIYSTVRSSSKVGYYNADVIPWHPLHLHHSASTQQDDICVFWHGRVITLQKLWNFFQKLICIVLIVKARDGPLNTANKILPECVPSNARSITPDNLSPILIGANSGLSRLMSLKSKRWSCSNTLKLGMLWTCIGGSHIIIRGNWPQLTN